MTLDEYRTKRDALNAQCSSDKRDLAKDYALSNRKADIGDIIEDYLGKVLAQKMGVTFGLGECPSIRYFGICLKKNGDPRKDGKKRWVYESRMVDPPKADNTTKGE